MDTQDPSDVGLDAPALCARWRTFHLPNRTIAGTLADLMHTPPCAGCRLILHLISPYSWEGCLQNLRNAPDLQSARWAVGCPSAARREVWLYSSAIADPGTLKGVLRNATASELEKVPQGSSQIDPRFVHASLRECIRSHQNCSKLGLISSQITIQGLRLVDVEKRCVIRARPTEQFIAFSYVWGRVDMPTLNDQTMTRLEMPGGLDQFWNNIPGSIRDAIILAGKLGERFIFIDSLCVHQSNQAEKYAQINQMNQIYQKARLTIVAASSRDAGSELPGVREGSRSSPVLVTDIDGIPILAAPPNSLTQVLDSSVYDTRAWTYQERILSVRSIFITEKEAVYHCDGSSIPDGGGLGVQERRAEYLSLGSSPEATNLHLSPLQSFYQSVGTRGSEVQSLFEDLVREYTRKTLSYPSDILNAFSGLMGLCESFGSGPFLFGIPEATFDLGLLWVSLARSRDRKLSDGLDPDTGHGLTVPSWSWASIDGPVAYRRIQRKSCSKKGDSLARIQPVWSSIDDFQLRDTPARQRVRRYYHRNLRVANGAGYSEPRGSTNALTHNKSVLLFESKTVTACAFTIDDHGSNAPIHSLAFVNRSIGDIDQSDERYFRIEDCGFLWIDWSRFLEHVGGGGTLDFVELSWQRERLPVGPRHKEDEGEDEVEKSIAPCPWRVENESRFCECCVVNLMLAGRTGAHWKRLGIARMKATNWYCAHPIMTKISLV